MLQLLLLLLLFTSAVDKIYAKNANFMQHMRYLCANGKPMWLVDARSRHIDRCTASQIRRTCSGMPSNTHTYAHAHTHIYRCIGMAQAFGNCVLFTLIYFTNGCDYD